MNELQPLENYTLEEFQAHAATLDEQKAKWLLVQMYAEYLRRGNIYLDLLRQQWGMGDKLE